MRVYGLHSFFLYKNVVFLVQAEYSYISDDFRLKIFLYYSYVIAYVISVLEYIGVSSIAVQVFCLVGKFCRSENGIS